MPQTRYCWPAWQSGLLLASLIAPLDAMAIVAVEQQPDPQSTASEDVSKAVSNDTSASSSSSSGLTSAQIGGIVGGLFGMLIVCVAITIWVIRHLRKTASARRNTSSRHSAHRRSAHGSGGSGGSGEHSGSGIRTSQHKIVPTPSQVDQLDYDDLLERETTATLAGGHTPSISGLSHTPTVGSSHAVVTPMEESAHPDTLGSSMNSPDQSISGDRVGSGAVRFAHLPPRSQNRPTWSSASSVGADGSVHSSGHRRQSAWQHFRQARLMNGNSISSASSSNRGTSRRPAELGVDGGFIPELPASSQEGAMRASSDWASSAWTRYAPAAARARAVSGASATSGISAASAGMQQTPGSDQYSGYIPSPMHSRDHSGSSASFHHGSHQQQQSRLDIVTESPVQDLHGHYGPTHAVAGQTLAGNIVSVDISTPIAP